MRLHLITIQKNLDTKMTSIIVQNIGVGDNGAAIINGPNQLVSTPNKEIYNYVVSAQDELAALSLINEKKSQLS